MATWLPHLKLSFGGDLGNPKMEIWNCTVRFKAGADSDNTDPSADFTSAQIDAALGALTTPLATWFASADAQLSSVAILNYAKLNWVMANGLQRDVNTHRVDTGPAAGGNGAANQPHWHTTFALTLRTGVARGRAHSGRIFPPAVHCPPELASPYISAAHANQMATAFATALNNISEAIQDARGDGTPVFPVVGSPASTSIGDTRGALLERITGVVVDRLADVQHRRTNAIPRLEATRYAVAGSG